ncbi:hypothetical protein [Caballeronia sp. LZ035]|uniref:hypothetical protein n=1 Tax=Caballeronia sp. LZ035 TaxID=3038568 RepID=UPI00285DD963|nr:hypothetical protein [Caballeronia sp. LZ035]MDR5757124.1 hypothetical protein [Caballeronia sp. LZ035]
MATYEVTIRVYDDVNPGGSVGTPIRNAAVEVNGRTAANQEIPTLKGYTNDSGLCDFRLEDGHYQVTTAPFGVEKTIDFRVDKHDCRVDVPVDVGFGLQTFAYQNYQRALAEEVEEGETVIVSATWSRHVHTDANLTITPVQGSVVPTMAERAGGDHKQDIFFATGGVKGKLPINLTLEHGARISLYKEVLVVPAAKPPVPTDVSVTMRRAGTDITDDISLWVVIRKSTEAMSFNNYHNFINAVLCGIPRGERLQKNPEFEALKQRRFLPFTDTDAYRLLKVATEAFVMVNCGVQVDRWANGVPQFDHDDAEYVARRIGQRPRSLEELWNRYVERINGTQDTMLPYLALIREKLADVRIKSTLFGDGLGTEQGEACFGILRSKLTHPVFTELIWSYWHEEGMLVQTMNAIARRFQNIRSLHGNDPLANLDIDPLRPLNSLLWGYIQDEQHRLSITRRAYEYEHEYALPLDGKAVGTIRAADVRSRFLEAFHQLLSQCSQFYGQDDNTTVVADGFPVLNALKEVHLILSEGAGNQFGGVPSTARIEMLTQLWLLARPEFREYLPTRIMVAYPEPWMDRVDAMKKLQGWSDASVLHFSNLGGFGEKILLSIRYGAWSGINDATKAANWARYWRPEIQGYVHAYRAVTGADLTAVRSSERVEATLPSTLLRQQLAQQKRRVA